MRKQDSIEMNLIKDFQSILFSSQLDPESIRSYINQHQNEMKMRDFDHQIILAFSLNYENFHILAPLLSKPEIQPRDIFHFDQKLILLLLQANISFPISLFFAFKLSLTSERKILLDQDLYEELSKQDQLKPFQYIINIKTKSEQEGRTQFRSNCFHDKRIWI